MTRINWRTPTDADFEEVGTYAFIAPPIYLVDVLSPGDQPVQQNQTRILTLSGRLCSGVPARVLGPRRPRGAGGNDYTLHRFGGTLKLRGPAAHVCGRITKRFRGSQDG